MWRPWVNINSGSASVPLKKKHLSLDAKNIVQNVYSSLLDQGLNASAAASVTSDMTKVPLTTVRRIAANPVKSRKKRKDTGFTKSLDEGDKDLIR